MFAVYMYKNIDMLKKMETILFRPPLANLYMQCVCGCEGNTCVCASEHKFGVATNHGKLRCDWAPMSNGFYLA
jgi:hypothetical protein